MRPQDRTRAILKTQLPASSRLLLVAIADHMDDERLTAWPKVETLASLTGLCERQVRGLLEQLVKAGAIRMWWGDHKTRDIVIEWSALPTLGGPPKAKRGGGRRPAIIATQAATEDGEATGNHCHSDRQSLPPGPAIIATRTGNHCPRSDHEATSEATSEATTPKPPASGAPPADAGSLLTETPDVETHLEADREPTPRGGAPDPGIAAGAGVDADGDPAPAGDGVGPPADGPGPTAGGAGADARRTDGGKVSAWVPRDCAGHPRGAVEAMVLAAVAELKNGAPVNAATCGTDAKQVLGLWRQAGTQDPKVFAADLCLVIRWARLSTDRAASHDIRAEDWPEGRDRSRSMQTLCVQSRWSERLDLARAWARRTGQTIGESAPAASTDPPADPRHAAAVAFLDAWSLTGAPGRHPVARNHEDSQRASWVATVLYAPGVGGWPAYYADPEGTRRRFLLHLASRKAA